MPAEPQEFTQFKGLLPGLDRKRIKEPYVVEGENFLVDIDGPVSIFGKEWLIHNSIEESRGIQSLRAVDEGQDLYFIGDSINIFDEDSHQLTPVYLHTNRQEFWPWTRALVNAKLYLVNKEVGLVEHCPTQGTWKIISGSNIPTTIYACCEYGGRLLLLSDVGIHWSAIDDATNEGFAASTSSGAGAQLLSLLSSATQPLMLLPYADGVLVYTTAGILRGERTNAANPFRWTILSRDHLPINPWCVIRVGEKNREQHVMLTKRGFFSTFGDAKPEAWEPLMGEYFHRNLLPIIKTNYADMTLRLQHNFDTGWVVVSVAEDSRKAIYNKAFVYYIPSEQWGVYTRAHKGFIEVFLSSGAFVGFFYGIVDVEGTVYRFNYADADLDFPSVQLWQVEYRKVFDMLARYSGLSTVAVMPTMMQFHTDDITYVDDAGAYDIRYELYEAVSPISMTTIDDTPDASGSPYLMPTAMSMQNGLLRIATAKIAGENSPLRARIKVGPFKLTQETQIDIVSQIHEAVIGMLQEGLNDTIVDYIADFIDVDVIEDWNDDAPDEDWGITAGDNTAYELSFVGTLDGYQTWLENNVEQLIVPATISQRGRNRYVAGTCSGIYLYLEITALNVGETFHLKHLRLNLTNAGQLY